MTDLAAAVDRLFCPEQDWSGRDGILAGGPILPPAGTHPHTHTEEQHMNIDWTQLAPWIITVAVAVVAWRPLNKALDWWLS